MSIIVVIRIHLLCNGRTAITKHVNVYYNNVKFPIYSKCNKKSIEVVIES